MKIEHKVGDRICIKGHTFEVIENKNRQCNDCALDSMFDEYGGCTAGSIKSLRGECFDGYREDNVFVKFKLIKK